MPFISERHLAKVEHALAKRHHTTSSHKGESMMAKTVQTVETVVVGAMGMGFLRGKMEDKSTGAWNIPGTSNVDVELVAGLGLLGASYFGKSVLGSYAHDVGNVANGVLAHYLGQVARKFAHTGQFSLIAGESPRQLLAGSPVGSGNPLRDALHASM